jgi:hypothetical protein
MPGLNDLISSGAPSVPMGSGPASAPASLSNSGLGGAGNNSLLNLVQQQQSGPATPRVAPSHDQTMAAMHRFHEVQMRVKPLLSDPALGKENIRPRLFDVAADLLGRDIVSLPEIMSTIKELPSDPQKQKDFVFKVYQSAVQAQRRILDDHRAGTQGSGDWETEAAMPSEWTPDSHGKHFKDLLAMYPKA